VLAWSRGIGAPCAEEAGQRWKKGLTMELGDVLQVGEGVYVKEATRSQGHGASSTMGNTGTNGSQSCMQTGRHGRSWRGCCLLEEEEGEEGMTPWLLEAPRWRGAGPTMAASGRGSRARRKKMEQRPSGTAVPSIARPGGNEPSGRREVGHGRNGAAAWEKKTGRKRGVCYAWEEEAREKESGC
jgi:hypothetical protein